MDFFKASDCTEESRKDETCLQFKMNKYFIKTRKIYQNEDMLQIVCVGQSFCWRIHAKWNTRSFKIVQKLIIHIETAFPQ